MHRRATVGVSGLLALVTACLGAAVAGQTPAAAAKEQSKGAEAARPAAPEGWTAPRTPWGDPDLQGIWSYATITPLERPGSLASREYLTPEEIEAANEEASTRNDRRGAIGSQADVDAAYNAAWWDRGNSTGRTSLIVDPPSGVLPPFTAEGAKRQAERAAYRKEHPADSWKDRPLQERCISYHGVPPLPTGYNNHYQIFQAPGLVAIFDENIHDVRFVPLDGRPHPSASIRQFNGVSRGRWEGETLVVETTNYRDETAFRFPNHGPSVRSVERFTRVGPDTVAYEYTIHDLATYTAPWTVSLPMTAIDGPLYEYACHEGNYGMEGLLSGARALEKSPGAARRR